MAAKATWPPSSIAAMSMSAKKLATTAGPSALVTALLAVFYLGWAPPSTDLAAQTFRADLFAGHGFVIWSEAWYGGFHVLGYSVLFPPLAALLGVRVAGALAAVAAAALFALIARRRFGDRAWLGSLWFAAGAGAWLFTGRMTFLLGVAIGLAAVLAADARRPRLAAPLAGLTALASPVAGVFVGLAGVAVALGAQAGARAAGAALALPPVAAIAVLGLAFPTGGEAPFDFSSFVAVPLFAAGALWLLPSEQRVLRIGVVLYAALAIAIFAIPNPLGGNVVRLGALFAGPLAALCLRSQPLVLAAVAVPLIYWQVDAPIRDAAAGVGDPSTERAYYRPVLGELERRGAAMSDPPLRIHVPPTANRWEAVYVAERFPLARGWLRQLESGDFELFDEGSLTAESYRAWLADHAVSYVAVPDADLDYLSRDEVSLIDGGLPYLRLVWEGADWRLYRFEGAPSLVAAIGGRSGDGERPQLRRLGPARFSLEGGPGEYLVRIHWTRYWKLDGADACAERDGDWTRVELRERGRVGISARISVGALSGRDRICSR
jgi:hypothetical protein